MSVEATTLYRQLSQTSPTSYLPFLAGALTNLGQRLAEVGRQAEALPIAEEAAAAYRQLAPTNPAAYVPNLARSLGALSKLQLSLGHAEDAVSALAEATEQLTPLSRQLPTAFGGLTSALLRDYATALEAVGRHEEAAELRRRL